MNFRQCISSITILHIFFNIYSGDISQITICFSSRLIEARHIRTIIEQENKQRCAQFGIDYSEQEKLIRIEEFYDENHNSFPWHHQFPQQLLQKILIRAPREDIHTTIEHYKQFLFPLYIPERLIEQESLRVQLSHSLSIKLIFKSNKPDISIAQQRPLEYIAVLLVYASFFVPISLFLMNSFNKQV